MKRLLVLLFAILLMACPKQPTPQEQFCGDRQCNPLRGENPDTCPVDCPKPPPPHGYCGDGKCGPAESYATCKRDCPAPLPVDKCGDKVCTGAETPESCPGDCQPAPQDKCDPDNYVFADCPPVVRDHTRIRFIGNYTGVTGQKNFNWSKYFQLFKKANGHIVHLMSPWSNMDQWGPFKKVGNQWTEEFDPTWWTHFDNMLEAGAHYKIVQGITVFDQYCDPQCGFCSSAWYKLSTHPFQRVCGKGNGQTFYANWLRRLPVCDNAVLMCWDANAEEDINTYRATSKEGRMFMKMMNEVAIRSAAALKKHPDLKFVFRLANEAFYYVTDDKGCGGLDHSRSRYLDDRSTIYFQKTLGKHGFKSGKNMSYVINEEFEVYGKYTDACWTDKTYRRYIVPNRYLYEFHSIANPSDLDFFLKQLKFNDAFFLPSSDGVKEDDQYFKNMRAIDKLGLKYFDFKLWAGGNGPTANNMNAHVQYYVPLMEKNIFE